MTHKSPNLISADYTRAPDFIFFGTSDRFLYVAQTRQTFWKQFRNRYFIGPKTLHELAKTREDELISKGLDAFTQEEISEYRKHYRSLWRLDFTIFLAKAGVKGSWFLFLPVEDITQNEYLESISIGFCDKWNSSKGYGAMFNKQR